MRWDRALALTLFLAILGWGWAWAQDGGQAPPPSTPEAEQEAAEGGGVEAGAEAQKTPLSPKELSPTLRSAAESAALLGLPPTDAPRDTSIKSGVRVDLLANRPEPESDWRA